MNEPPTNEHRRLLDELHRWANLTPRSVFGQLFKEAAAALEAYRAITDSGPAHFPCRLCDSTGLMEAIIIDGARRLPECSHCHGTGWLYSPHPDRNVIQNLPGGRQ